jgi:hypothetical protein
VYATIGGQVFHPIGTDSFNSILKECRAQIDRRIDAQRPLETRLNETGVLEDRIEAPLRYLRAEMAKPGNRSPRRLHSRTEA